MNAEIVTTGTEILLGEIVDTNAAYIAQQLREIGVNLYYKTTVGDNEGRLRAVLEAGLARSDLIVLTGGLGPTADDITRDAVANTFGAPLKLRPDLAEAIRSRFESWGAVMTENNLRQAYLPRGAQVIENPVGTAPGFIMEDGRGMVIALPGVPREMKYLMEHAVIPYIQSRMDTQAVIMARILRTVAIGESAVDDLLGELMQTSNPTVGLAAHAGQTDIRITARAETRPQALVMLDEMEARVRERVGEYVYGEGQDEVEDVVGKLLAERGLRLALLETNTMGEIAARLGKGAGSEPLVVQAVQAPDAQQAAELAGIAATRRDEHSPNLGALSTGTLDSAATIAQALRASTGMDWALVILGSGEQVDSARVDRRGFSYAALSTPDALHQRRLRFGGSDELARRWVGNAALDMLRRVALSLPLSG